MQPYFFPYIGYYGLIQRVDRWIIFDTAQYIRHGWVNRNRILHPTTGWQYVIVPLAKHTRDTAIQDILAADPAEWVPRILGQIAHYRKRAPYYRQTRELVERCLDGSERRLSRINGRILALTCAHLGIPFEEVYFSEMALELGPVEGPGDWALRIAASMGATEYINPPGGVDLFDPRRFEALGIRLTIQRPFEFSYPCPGYTHEPGLSILDVMMWLSPEEIRTRLHEANRLSGE